MTIDWWKRTQFLKNVESETSFLNHSTNNWVIRWFVNPWFCARSAKGGMGRLCLVTYNSQKKVVSPMMRCRWVLVIGILFRIFRLCIIDVVFLSNGVIYTDTCYLFSDAEWEVRSMRICTQSSPTRSLVQSVYIVHNKFPISSLVFHFMGKCLTWSKWQMGPFYIEASNVVFNYNMCHGIAI